MSDSLWPHGLYSPWNSPGQNTGVGSCSLLQGIFPVQGSNPGLQYYRQIIYQLGHQGSLYILYYTKFKNIPTLKVKVLITQSCPTLCNLMDCSPPGSSVHRILQVRTLEWVSSPFSRGSFHSRDWIWVSWHCGQILYHLSHQGSPTLENSESNGRNIQQMDR